MTHLFDTWGVRKDGQTGRQTTHRQTDKQTESQAGRQAGDRWVGELRDMTNRQTGRQLKRTVMN